MANEQFPPDDGRVPYSANPQEERSPESVVLHMLRHSGHSRHNSVTNVTNKISPKWHRSPVR